MSVKLTREEVADIIERFLDGTSGPSDWGDFCSVSIKDPDLDEIRRQCCQVMDVFPATKKGHYCSEEGFRLLRGLISKLRSGAV